MEKNVKNFMSEVIGWYRIVYEDSEELSKIPQEELKELWSDSNGNISKLIKMINKTYKIDIDELVELWEEVEKKSGSSSSSIKEEDEIESEKSEEESSDTPMFRKKYPKEKERKVEKKVEKTPEKAKKSPAKKAVDKKSPAKKTVDKKFSKMLDPSEYKNSVITITFGDQAENHVGMEKIGTPADKGFSIEKLEKAKEKLEKAGVECELINLNESLEKIGINDAPPAVVLKIKNAVNFMLEEMGADTDDLFNELVSFPWDTKAKMYGRVVDKHARHNVCFYETPQEPNYEEGKGRIVAYDDVPLLNSIRENLPKLLGKDAKDLAGEGNFYYDTNICGIGFHGDSERKKVVALRVGQNSTPMHYQWFKDSKPVGERIIVELDVGDIYAMSEKAVGSDWKSKKIYTLRHATGCKKFTTIEEKKEKKEKK